MRAVRGQTGVSGRRLFRVEWTESGGVSGVGQLAAAAGAGKVKVREGPKTDRKGEALLS